MVDSTGFDRRIERWVVDAVRADQVRSFDDLVCLLPGVYPTDIRAAVDSLEVSGALPSSTIIDLRRRDFTRAQTVAVPAPHLPVPHPLDYDWRFSSAALERLVAECDERSNGDRIALIGAPTLFWALLQRRNLPAFLLDANRRVIDALNLCDGYGAQVCDVGTDPLPVAAASVAVLDPPWYRDHEELFLWAASRLVLPGGTVLISLPAEGTRPGVAEENQAALARARDWGLEVAWRDPGALSYLSPPFEQNALMAAGIQALPLVWRRGDLVALTAAHPSTAGPPSAVPGCSWDEVAVGRVRFRIRDADEPLASRGSPELLQLVPGDVLDTVSRRDPRRDLVMVWTSGNRVFGCADPHRLRRLLESIALAADGRVMPSLKLGRAAEEPATRRTVDQLLSLIATETTELTAMGWAA
jgi:hypothetical protein